MKYFSIATLCIALVAGAAIPSSNESLDVAGYGDSYNPNSEVAPIVDTTPPQIYPPVTDNYDDAKPADNYGGGHGSSGHRSGEKRSGGHGTRSGERVREGYESVKSGGKRSADHGHQRSGHRSGKKGQRDNDNYSGDNYSDDKVGGDNYSRDY